MGLIETLPRLLHTAITTIFTTEEDVLLKADKNHFRLRGFISKSLLHEYLSN